MRAGRLTGILAAVVMFAGAGRIWADSISLADPSAFQSYVESEAADASFGFNDDPVDSLPYTTPLTFTEQTTSSTTTPNLSTSALLASFSATIVDLGASAHGVIDIFFTANSNVSYAIAGTETVVGNPANGTLASYLYDENTETFLYNDYEAFSDTVGLPGVQPLTAVADTNTLTLAATGNDAGTSTGTLTAGDTYEYLLYAGMDSQFADPTLTGNGGITFAQTPPGGSSVPLPNGVVAGVVALGMVLGWRGSRREVGAA